MNKDIQNHGYLAGAKTRITFFDLFEGGQKSYFRLLLSSYDPKYKKRNDLINLNTP